MANNPTISGNPGKEGSHYSFRCRDVMPGSGCDFEAHGTSQDEVMRKAENHGRTSHGIEKMDDGTRMKVRDNIKRAA